MVFLVNPKHLKHDLKYIIVTLSAWILTSGSLSLVAQNPPLIPETKIIRANDAASRDQFGDAVAISGDYLAVGAPLDDDGGLSAGSVYLFARNQGGTSAWGFLKKLHANDPQAGDQFGAALAFDGDTLVVGAYHPPMDTAGKVYVFQKDQGGANQWGLVKKLEPLDNETADQFGWSVAIDGDLIVVGANKDNTLYSNVGSATVFGRNVGGANQWGQIKKIVPEDGAESDQFGESVAVNGETLLVGAPGDADLYSNAGSAQIYQRNLGGPDQWGLVKKVYADDALESDQFGNAVAIDGDTIAVGAALDDRLINGVEVANTGSVYLFERNVGGTDAWGQTKHVFGPKKLNDRFGVAVAIKGDILLIGSLESDEVAPDTGSAYWFARHQGGNNQWGLVGILAPSVSTGVDKVGETVALDGIDAAAGAPRADLITTGGSTVSDTGSTFLFRLLQEAPNMTIVRDGNDVVVSWTPETPGFVLQTSATLTPESWSNTTSGGMMPARFPVTTAPLFFRLKAP